MAVGMSADSRDHNFQSNYIFGRLLFGQDKFHNIFNVESIW
jgi:hypothetical protein